MPYDLLIIIEIPIPQVRSLTCHSEGGTTPARKTQSGGEKSILGNLTDFTKYRWFTNYTNYEVVLVKKLNMKYSHIIFAVTIGIFIVTASCKKSEEAKIESVEEVQAKTPRQEGLAMAMKNASVMMRRLARAVENNDWVEMDIWTEELKEGIGFNCVELYMIENSDVSNEFMILSSNFNSALNKLNLSSKEQDSDNANLEFNNLVKSCDACHDSFNEDTKTKLDFTD